MSVTVFFLWNYLENFAYKSLWMLILFLFLVIILGAGIYIACTILLKMEEVKFVLGLFRKLKRNVKS